MINGNVDLMCKIHNQKVISGQVLPNHEVKMFCQTCLSEQQILPIDKIFADTRIVAEKKIDQLGKAEKEKLKEFAKMKKTYQNLKQCLTDKIDQIIKVIEEGEKKLTDQRSTRVQELNESMRNPGNQFIQNMAKEQLALESQLLLETEKQDVLKRVQEYNQQLNQIIAKETQEGMMSQTIQQKPPQQGQVLQQPTQTTPQTQSKIRVISQSQTSQQLLQQPPPQPFSPYSQPPNQPPEIQPYQQPQQQLFQQAPPEQFLLFSQPYQQPPEIQLQQQPQQQLLQQPPPPQQIQFVTQPPHQIQEILLQSQFTQQPPFQPPFQPQPQLQSQSFSQPQQAPHHIQPQLQAQAIQQQPPQQPPEPDSVILPELQLQLIPQSEEPALRRLQSQPEPPAVNITERKSSKIRLLSTTLQSEKQKLYRYDINQQFLMEQCETMIISKDDKYFVNGNSTDIQIWKFNQDGTLAQPIELKGNKTQVLCLCFSKQNSWFISGFYDGTIKIWQQQQNGDWNSIQTLTAHKTYVKSLILTNQEDQFISYSDKQIKVWMKNNVSAQWQCYQTVTETAVQLLFLSLSPNSQLFASTDYTGKFIIWQREPSNIWKEKQVIANPINDKYIRISFIEDNEIIATTENQGKLIQFFLQNEEFKIGAEYPLNPEQEVNCLAFPIVYNSQLKLAIVRHNNNVSILTKSSNGQFVVNSVIQGNFWQRELSSNGQYLFMWCKENKSIQIWKMI